MQAPDLRNRYNRPRPGELNGPRKRRILAQREVRAGPLVEVCSSTYEPEGREFESLRGAFQGHPLPPKKARKCNLCVRYDVLERVNELHRGAHSVDCKLSD